MKISTSHSLLQDALIWLIHNFVQIKLELITLSVLFYLPYVELILSFTKVFSRELSYLNNFINYVLNILIFITIALCS